MLYIVTIELAKNKKDSIIYILLDKSVTYVYNNKTGLDGELAVPCNLQSATAGLNSCLGVNWLNMCVGFWR